MTPKAFLDGLHAENADFTSDKQAKKMANLLNVVSSDIYSESQRFVFELIQNADDASNGGENMVHFNFLNDSVIISHNGKPFDEKDIASISDAGDSTKTADPTKTGYKGIGFKSVFGKSERVSIYSGDYFFRFDKAYFGKVMPWQGIPIWSELNEYSDDIQNALKEIDYNVSTIIEINNSADLNSELNEIIGSGQILLFLRHITKIVVSENGREMYAIQKKTIEQTSAFTEVTLFENDMPISTWLLKTFEAIPIPAGTKQAVLRDEKMPDKIKESKFVEISFAAKLQDQKITSLSREESLIFTYLPTKVKDFNFPFLVNSSFITSAARESVNEDKVWNQWLFTIIAEFSLRWLSELAVTKYKYQILQILPKVFNHPGNELKNAFDKQFVVASSEKAFIPTARDAVKKVSEVLIDKTGLSEQAFLDEIAIIEFLRVEKGLNYTSDCFVHKSVENISVLNALGITTFDADNIGLFFNSDAFKSRHRLESNFALVKYFKELSDDDASGVWFQTLKTLPFIFSDNNQLLNPSTGICFPLGVTTTELGNIPVIHEHVFREIQSNQILFDWLKSLGVKQPSSLAYVTNVIIPGLSQDDYINDDNYLPITFYLFRLFQERKLTPDLLESLRELRLKVIGPPVAFVEAQKCYLSERYRPRFNIQYLITEVSYVSESYLTIGDELKWNMFFKAIKVKEDIEIETINSNNSLITMRRLTNPAWVQLARQLAEAGDRFGFGETNVIYNTKIPSFLNLTATNYDYAKIFWSKLIDAGTNLESLQENARYYYGVGNGYNSYSSQVGNYFPWYVQNIACIPATNGQLLVSTNVFINDKNIRELAGGYLPVFEHTGILNNAWKNFFKFKDRLSIDEYLLILKSMADDFESLQPRETLSVARIGNIYNRLATMIDDMAEDDLDVLRVWGATNKLYAANDKFEPVGDLCWITIDGFTVDTTNIKVIRLPSITKEEKSGFRKLMFLFGVKIIDEFIPKYAKPVIDLTLKIAIERILPYFAALVGNKSGKPINEEFERLYQIIDNTDFYSAKEIRLSFQFDQEFYEGPLLTVYRQDAQFYFKGKWRSERILLTLIKELSFLLKVKGFNEELRFLLLEQDDNEILEWLKEQQIVPDIIPDMRRFNKKILEDVEYIDESLADLEVEPSWSEELVVSSRVVIQRDESIQESEAVISKFTPDIKVNDIDVSESAFRIPERALSEVVQQPNYEPVSDMDFRLDVGRWSEEYVNKLLRQDAQYTEIEWMNEHVESGKPYDFKVKKSGEIKYLEVKGTPSDSKKLIYLSAAEWNLMSAQKEHYAIFRVYNAGKQDCICEVFGNPAEMIEAGQIGVAITL